jgi:gamma-glutamylcyclotransferase (GGCT)/AIG2-like uncharacterized protein YtfP
MSTRLFVYGLLRPDAAPPEVRPWLDRARDCGEASVAGLIYDLGAYPAAVPGEGRVRGRVLRWQDGVDWALLDHWEGCDRKPPLYRREQVTAQTGAGPVEAWIYWYCGRLEGREPLASGRWEGRA